MTRAVWTKEAQSKGGKGSLRTMSPEERRDRGRKGAAVMHARRRAKLEEEADALAARMAEAEAARIAALPPAPPPSLPPLAWLRQAWR